jgi:translation initiation factor IF-3
VGRFLTEVAAFGHPDFEPKLLGRGINVMISPLPRNKRAKNPRQVEGGQASAPAPSPASNNHPAVSLSALPNSKAPAAEPKSDGFANNPFARINLKPAT